MLVLTDNATNVITSLVSDNELPAGAGLRISASGDGAQPLTLSTAVVPDAADQVVEEHGARVFLDSDAALMLEDKVLDAEVSDQGKVQFLLAPQ